MKREILNVERLHKRFGRIHALNDVSLTIREGEVWGILGPNGSGKTTLLSIVLDVLQPDSGSFSWFGSSTLTNPRLHIGSLLETPNFYPHLNAIDNLKIIAKIKHIDQNNFDDLLRTVDLYDRRKSTFKTYSLGMKQRLAIAGTLVGDPDVLILDEPANGLDPVGISEMRTLIQQLAQQSKTIIMASHILDEVEKICDHVAILKNGIVRAQGKVGQLLSPKKRVTLKSGHEGLYDLLYVYPQIDHLSKEGPMHKFEVTPDFPLEELYAYITTQGIILTGIEENKVSLEEEFIQITKN